jgi:hypothetical protein
LCMTRCRLRYMQPVESSIEIIRQAIRERKMLEFQYHSLPRIVEPMRLGQVKRGIWELRAHQISGKSASGRVADGTPKLFTVAEMADISILPISFEVPVFYERSDTTFIHIDTEL